MAIAAEGMTYAVTHLPPHLKHSVLVQDVLLSFRPSIHTNPSCRQPVTHTLPEDNVQAGVGVHTRGAAEGEPQEHQYVFVRG